MWESGLGLEYSRGPVLIMPGDGESSRSIGLSSMMVVSSSLLLRVWIFIFGARLAGDAGVF